MIDFLIQAYIRQDSFVKKIHFASNCIILSFQFYFFLNDNWKSFYLKCCLRSINHRKSDRYARKWKDCESEGLYIKSRNLSYSLSLCSNAFLLKYVGKFQSAEIFKYPDNNQINLFKVHVFQEGHKKWPNLHCRFDIM